METYSAVLVDSVDCVFQENRSLVSMAQIPQYSLADIGLDAAADFDRCGCMIINDFLTAEHVSSLEQHVREQSGCDSTLTSIQVGDRRRMTPIPICDAMNDESVFASAELMKFLPAVLGEKFVLSVFSCVTSDPGSSLQHRHRDSIGLFNSPVDYFCPSFAINLFIPLVSLNEQTGTTRLWPGTHRNPVGPEDVAETDAVTSFIPTGSAMLMDYRLIHEGTPNVSQQPRPIMCLAYTRDWFVDTHHFKKVSPLNMEVDDFLKLPKAHQQLLGGLPRLRAAA